MKNNITMSSFVKLDLQQKIDDTKRSMRQAELKKYFPGLYSKAENEKKSYSISNPTKQIPQTSFSSHLQKEITKSDIKQEVQGDLQKKKLYEAALEFQALFLDKMLESMRKNLNPENDLLYGGFRQKIFSDMLYQEYSHMLSRSDNFTLADDIYRQMRPALD